MTIPKVMILGKVPPPHIGPAVATQIILNSELNDRYNLIHFDTKINTHVQDLGKVRFSKFKSVWDMYRRFGKTLKKTKPEVILIPIGQTTVGFFKDLPLIRRSIKSGAKVVLHLRGSAFRTWFDALDPIRRNRVKRVLKATHGVIVLGENLRHLFDGLYPEERIHVVPNGGDYTFPARKNPNLRITYLANYLPGKGLAEVLEALKLLGDKPDLPNFEFVGYGQWDDEEYRRKCMAIAGDLDVRCTLNGPISGSDKWQALADTDIFVFAPSSPEGHPWSVVEALAAGLPIVATDQGAISQNVDDGKNGFLIDHPQPEFLARHFETLLKDEELRREMGRESRNIYESGFTEAAMVENLARVFDELLENHVRNPRNHRA